MLCRRFVLAVLAPALPALSQTVWTSFEDRAGHAIASDPNGGVLMFGGESLNTPGQLLGDTNRLASNNSAWARQNPSLSPEPRRGHAMASGTATDQPAFFLFGGLKQTATGTSTPTNETWRYQGDTWGNITGPVGAARPSARTGHGMVTDLLRNTIVLFGGFSGGLPRNDVWEFDLGLESWSQSAVVGVPPPHRAEHAMAYDPGTNRVYLFGGAGFSGLLNDMWAYDPTARTWANVTPATSPSQRTDTRMAWLLGYGVLLFGGKDSSNQPLGDTWKWNPVAQTWTQETGPPSPPARYGHALAQDQSGQNLVLVGGTGAGGQPVPGTWLWNRVAWVQQLPPPSPRSDVAMTYDSTRNRHVLFGGRSHPAGADLGDTWELDGLNWRQRSPSSAPSPRADAGMAYDSARQRTVLYGGRSSGACGTELADTWEWDGQNWLARTVPNNPPAAGGIQPVFDSLRNRIWMLVRDEMWSYDGNTWLPPVPRPLGRGGLSASYDLSRQRLVIFGGGNAGGAQGDTWEWDGVTWFQRTTTVSPAARVGHAMAYDAVRGEHLIYGGGVGSTRYNDSWRWDGNAWTQGPNIDPGRTWPCMTYDGRGQQVVLTGGFWNVGNWTNECYVWNGSAWVGPPGAPLGVGRDISVMAYDPLRQKVVLFGGRNSGGKLADTWEFDGNGWTQRAPASAPSARDNHGMAFDVHTGRVLLFGGHAAVPMADTWSWDGTTWIQHAPLQSPNPRTSGRMVSTGTRTLLVGGWDYIGGVERVAPDLIWEWTGVTWQLVDSGTPPVRTNYGAAYDARRDRVVVFGGMSGCDRNAATFLGETWEWDGSKWLQRFPLNAPSPRAWSKLSYDAFRGRVVLFGGKDRNSTFADTWEWDGTDWTLRLPTNSPPSSAGHGLTYDRQRRLTVGFGTPGTWDYGTTEPGSMVAFGTGCSGSAGVPTLSPLPWAGPWLGDRMQIDITNRPPGLGIFVLGFSNTTWNGLPLPLPLVMFGSSCPLHVSVDTSDMLFPGTSRYTSFQIPNRRDYLGAVMYGQAGFFDEGQPGLPVVTSNALRMVFGAR